jgi:hypothetical protein
MQGLNLISLLCAPYAARVAEEGCATKAGMCYGRSFVDRAHC